MYKVREKNIELGATFLQRCGGREFEVAKGFDNEFSLVSYEPTHFHMEGSRERLASELNRMDCQGLVKPLGEVGDYTRAKVGAKYVGVKLHGYADTDAPFETSMVVSGIVSYVSPTNENWEVDQTDKTLAAWGVGENQTHQLQWTRTSTGDTLTGDFTVKAVRVTFS